MNAVKKPNIKAGLEDILLSDDDSDSGVIIHSPATAVQSAKVKDKSVEKKIEDQEKSEVIQPQKALEKSLSLKIPPPKKEMSAPYEHLGVAQERIHSLQSEIDHLRQENERLSVSCDSLRTSGETLEARFGELEKRKREELDKANYEKNLAQDRYASKDREVEELKHKVEELESRLQNDLKKIRVRERELQNRLELVKVENSALLRSKDEMVLDLKRQIDKLYQEIESAKNRNQILSGKNDLNDDRMLRSVKALRLALSLLEGEEVTNPHLKKVD